LQSETARITTNALEKPSVSVSIPTFNAEGTVIRCLDSLVGQSYKPMEIFVVDDGSTDSTSSKVSEYSVVHPEVKLLGTPHMGASHARNEGLSRSKGDVVLFADSDAYYDTEYLARATAALSGDHGIGAVCVTGGIWIVQNTVVSRCIEIEYAIKQRLISQGKLGPYFAYVYTREALSRVGGYDESLFQGEDKDVFFRVKEAGFRAALVPGLNWFHLYPQNWTSLVKRSYRGGRTRILYVVKRRRLNEYARSTGLFWVALVLAVIGFFQPIFWAILAVGFVAGYVYRLVRGFHLGSGAGSPRDLFALPLVSFVRYFATALGYVRGTLVYLARKILGKAITWSDL